jgi:DNA-binding NarL/FixJ family response regulator
VLSVHAEPNIVRDTLAAGAMGYVLKTYLFDDLCSAIRSAAAGNHYLSPAIAGVVVSEYVHGGSGDQSGCFRLLSSREREIVQLIAEGKTTKQVALTLHLSHKTVDSARRAAMAKLGISSIAELTKFAIREGITSVGC